MPPSRAKYVQVRDHLLSEVRSNLSPGSPIPSERELCKLFRVSRMTVRQAIDTLVVDGVLERHQGKGTFVAQPKVDLQVRLTSFTQEMRRRGMEPGSVFLLAETIPASNAVAEQLERVPGTAVHHLRRLLTADSTPMAIEENWIPADALPDLLDGALNFSVYERLTGAGLPPAWGEDLIEAHAATIEEATLLSVREGAPTLAITRRTFHEHTVIDYSHSIYRADRYALWVPVAVPAPAVSRPTPRSKGAAS
ncbi:HTH-type transcriptional repressor yvoA [Actinomyces bovis]|uniref:HTH-type transcriptional repressor yvoA n=1 Tax=Actinomyces bovis TaxID=1658 RepID=A0ABY1VKT9_9ACTO|nr:GntR family transcriptional regulator [Actinomyces bovis]SPT52706.1 HTH-type transcriptional repressor yvoA [Actinomyces bovis]VEG54656.1 HTH-type transcriptional repressor yvoA [Actinomyces israelii]